MLIGLRQLFRFRYAAWWTLAGGLAVTAALGWELRREALEMDRQRLAMRVQEIQGQLDARLEKSEMLLHNLRDYLIFSGESREPVFKRWCYENGLTINCPWILGLAVVTNRNYSPWREIVPKHPETWTTNDWNKVVWLAFERPLDCEVILKSEVSGENQFLPDYDLRPAWKDTFSPQNSVNRHGIADRFGITGSRSSRLGMSDRRVVMLDEKSNAITGTLFYVPLHRPEFAELLTAIPLMNLPLPNVRLYQAVGRWLDLESAIIAPVDFSILARSVWDDTPADLGVEIFSSTNQTAETWMNLEEGLPRAANPEFKAYLTHRQLWPMYGLKFSLFFYTTPLFEAQSPRRMANVSMGAGVMMTLLASALVGVAHRAQHRQARMIEQIGEARDALAAAQRERNNISRNLHDGTVQSLYSIQLALSHAAREIESAPLKGSHAVMALHKEVDAVIAEIRQFITTDSGADEPFDFTSVLESLVQRARAGTATRINLDCNSFAAQQLSAEQAVQLANIVREALSNSLRHGRPQEIQVVLSMDSSEVTLKVSDNGRGFDPKLRSSSGVGMASMASRASEIGGRFDLRSARGHGTEIEVCVPVRADEHEKELASASA